MNFKIISFVAIWFVVGLLLTSNPFKAVEMHASSFVFAGELQPKFPGYPECFDLEGNIDSLQGNNIVVDDRLFILSSGAVFHGPSGLVKQAKFEPGTKVGLKLSGERIISSLWLLEPSKDRHKQNSHSQKPGKSFYFENGVWKNR